MTRPVDISRIRTQLLLNFPWFGTLAMRLKIEATDKAPTFEVDGTTLRYNPEFAASLTDAELLGVMAHEVFHCALLHPYRRGARDPETWNKACDYAVNPALEKAGLTLPAGALVDPQYDGLAAEQIYGKLANKPDDQPSSGGSPKPNPLGSVQDAPQPAAGEGEGQQPGQGDGAPQQSETDWQIAAEQAARVAKASGKMPGNIERELQKSRESTADWRAILREFVEHTTPSDYSWTSPNRRHVANGVYLPGVTKENTGVIAVGVDTSGSISPALLNCFAAELQAIMQETKPESLYVVYCDAQVNRTEQFEPYGDEVQLKPCGGGGTRFQPVFDHLAAADVNPRALVYLTDLENGRETLEAPEYPVLWVTPEWVTAEGEFGATVRIQTEE